jgi:hypothetical protein
MLGPGHVGQCGQLGGVLPGDLAGQRVRGPAGGHQPREPAGRGVVQVLVVVVGHAPQVARQVDRPPFGTRSRGQPGRIGELGRQLTDDGDPIAVGGQNPRAWPRGSSTPGATWCRCAARFLSCRQLGSRSPGGKVAKPRVSQRARVTACRQAVRPEKKSGDNLSPARLTSRLMPSVSPLLVTRASARVRPVGALWRLRGYLKPFRTQMIVMFGAALGAVAAEIAIPLLTKSVIDGAIAHGDKRLLIPLALAAIGLGVAVALLNMIRRWIQSTAVAQIEKSIRDDLYAHLQRLQAGVPRPVAVRPAAVAGDDRPVLDPQVRRVRADLPGHQRHDVRRGGRAADQPQLVARPDHRRGVRPGAAGLLQVREALPGALPPGPGPAGRPGDADRGGGDRHPGAEGARPGPAGRRQARRPGRGGLPDAGRPRPACSGRSGPCST